MLGFVQSTQDELGCMFTAASTPGNLRKAQDRVLPSAVRVGADKADKGEVQGAGQGTGVGWVGPTLTRAHLLCPQPSLSHASAAAEPPALSSRWYNG